MKSASTSLWSTISAMLVFVALLTSCAKEPCVQPNEAASGDAKALTNDAVDRTPGDVGALYKSGGPNSDEGSDGSSISDDGDDISGSERKKGAR